MPELERARGDLRRHPGVPVDGPPAGEGGPPGPSDAALRLLLEDSAEDLYEHAPCGYLSVLLDGTIVKVNQTFLAWTGHERRDLVGRVRFPSLLTVGGRIFYETHLAPMLRLQGGIREIALDLLLADGRTLPVLVNSRVRTDDAGTPVLVRIMVLDARERTAYERELLRARQAAEESEARVRALQQVTADLAAASGVDEVARVVVAAGGRLFGTVQGEVWLPHPETRQLVPRPSTAGHEPAEAVQRLAELAQQGEPVFAGPPEPVPDLVARVVLPLVMDGAALGVLRLELVPPRALSAPERAVLVTLAAQAALALSRARLHEETALAATRSGFLARLGRELQEVPSVLERAERLVELTAQEADQAVVLMPGPAGGWRAVAGRPAPPEGALPEAWTSAADRATATDSPQALGPGGPSVPGSADPAAGVAGTGVVLALRARGRPLGALVLTRESRPFWTSELMHLMDVAERGGLALENARLYEREHGVAYALQRSLLPDRLPEDPRLELVPHYRPAVEGLDVGGDWYDAFHVAPDVVGVVVGDVVGRGIGAASAMGQLRSAVRALATGRVGPARLLERLDAFVEHIAAARMATIAYLEVDVACGTARYACAGHPPPVVLEPGLAARLEWGGRSAPLGARAAGGPRVEVALPLPPGARLVLYTDGLVERRRRPLADGLAHLVAEVESHRARPLPELVEALADGLLAEAVGLDDVCVLAVGNRANAPLEVALPARLDRLSGARADLHAWLTAVGVVGEDVDGLVLAASEALANAIEHGCGGQEDAVVVLTGREVGGVVELRVSDPGTWSASSSARAGPRPRGLGQPRPDAPADAERGRGLVLRPELTDEVRVERGEGTVVVLQRRVRGKRQP